MANIWEEAADNAKANAINHRGIESTQKKYNRTAETQRAQSVSIRLRPKTLKTQDKGGTTLSGGGWLLSPHPQPLALRGFLESQELRARRRVSKATMAR